MEVKCDSESVNLKDTFTCPKQYSSSFESCIQNYEHTFHSEDISDDDYFHSKCDDIGLDRSSTTSNIHRQTSNYLGQVSKSPDGETELENKCVESDDLSNSTTNCPVANCLRAVAHETMESESSNDTISNSQIANASKEKEIDHSEIQESLDGDGDLLQKQENILTADETSEGLSEVHFRRTRRNSKRKRDGDTSCPVCGVTVRIPELELHFSLEVEKLTKISKNIKKPPKDDNGISTTYVRVKSNRENRLTAKVAKYAAKAKKEVQCPICSVRMSGCSEEVNKHVLLCIQHENSNVDEYIDVDGDETNESFEEYEIGNETRVRAISFIPGGYQSLQGQTSRYTASNEEEDVDVDDTMAFGEPQYTELDVIPNLMYGNDAVHEQLRKAVLVDPTVQPQVLESRKWSESTGLTESIEIESSKTTVSFKLNVNDDPSSENEQNPTSSHIVSSLKEKIKELEDQTKNVKCLICMESYTKPLVSTTCWHVHCEECWLMTMGMKKLCPQCNMIVFPSDLRKIFL